MLLVFVCFGLLYRCQGANGFYGIDEYEMFMGIAILVGKYYTLDLACNERH